MMRGCGSSTGNIARRNAEQKSMMFANSLADSVPRVRSLHRDMLRSVPWVKRAYCVPLSEAKMRSLITVAFLEKAEATDMHQINRLVALGRMELEETLMLWKGESHVNGLFDRLLDKEADLTAAAPTFLEDFFAGRK